MDPALTMVMVGSSSNGTRNPPDESVKDMARCSDLSRETRSKAARSAGVNSNPARCSPCNSSFANALR